MRFVALFFLLIAPLAAEDWPQFRGLHRDGVSAETGLLSSWPSGGPRLVWKISGLGDGYAQPVVVGGRVYTQGQYDKKHFVIALDAATGKKLWETRSGKSYFHQQAGPGPRGTPTVDGDRVYALQAEGTLTAHDAATGDIVWTKNILQEYGGADVYWGLSESPLVDGERLIVTPGGPGAAVVALDKRTGKVTWKAGNDSAGHSSAIVADIGGVHQVLAMTQSALWSIEANTGEILWRYDKIFNRNGGIATPLLSKNHAFIATAFDTDCALLTLGARSMTEAYSRHQGMTYFYYANPVLVDKTLYSFSNTFLTAMDFATGNVAWKDRSVGKGSLAYADSRLYVLGEDGGLALVEPSPSAYKEISRFDLGPSAPARTPPVISGGKLYVRVQDDLYCFDVRKSR